MREVVITDKNELYSLCSEIHRSILEGLKKSEFYFSIDNIYGEIENNNWEILKGALLAFIHIGYDKWSGKK